MRKKIEIDEAELLRLKGKMSAQALANKFKVSKATMKRRLRELDGNATDKQVIAFSTKLEKLVADVPNDFCRKELLRAINLIRTRHAIPDSKRKENILNFLREYSPVPLEADEIAHATGLPKKEVETLLDQMVDENKILRSSRGGTMNRGRRKKFNYTILN